MSALKKRKPPLLSVVTISWNQKEDIIEYLEAMSEAKENCKFPVEMILVDNGSVDGTPELIESEYPWVKLIRNEKNEGFAVGCNVGLHAATGDYLLLFNPDARANGRAFEGMIKFMEKHPQVGGVGCQLLHDDGLPQQSAFEELSPLSYVRFHSALYPLIEKLRKFAYRVKLIGSSKPYGCGWVQASCLMVPRAVYEQVGDLEASFFIYCEDTDWCHRIRRSGYRIVHIPSLKISHRQMGSVGKKPEFFFRRVYRSIVHYTNRQFNGSKRDRIFRMMLRDMQLRRPIYMVLGYIRPAKKDQYKERIKSVDRLIAIINSRNPDLFHDPPPK